MEIRDITIIGAGLMGSGIAQPIAKSGFEVAIQSRREKGGLVRLQRGIQKAVNRRILTEDQAVFLLCHINCTSSLRDALKIADLRINRRSCSQKRNISRNRYLLPTKGHYCVEYFLIKHICSR